MSLLSLLSSVVSKPAEEPQAEQAAPAVVVIEPAPATAPIGGGVVEVVNTAPSPASVVAPRKIKAYSTY